MQTLIETYHSKGLEVICFPCNQFGGQEPGTPEEIQQFVTEKFGFTGTMTEKIEVNGPNAHPLYIYLKNEQPGMVSAIKWNFTKFLVDREGNVVKRFEPTTAPSDIEPAIRELLGLNKL
mmetsp:Transcript_20059/g.29655  ORF Transcript_20059/g.29655 Transcript_20059/m.29655 type:complete len:119 (+) Transcript_20059:56-412(+)